MRSHDGRAGLAPPPLANLALSRSAVDRRSDWRSEPDLFDRLVADDRTLVLEVADGRVPSADGRLVFRPARAADLEDRDRLALLGEAPDGTAYLLSRADEPEEPGEPGEGWLTLRELGAVLTDLEAGLMVEAVALSNWHRTHTHCPRCGADSLPASAGWTRVCTSDGSEHYPRTDPAVIMAVVDDDDRLLLGHGATWPRGRFSTLAGFVEPGESLEAAVRREVWEEVGVRIGDVVYRGSQPWPFPASVMLGFRASAVTVELDVDGSEIDDARWFSRAGLLAAIESGELLMSPNISIARRLIEDWYGEPVPTTPESEAWRPS